jgi:type II secretion system (T2SS) protein E
MSNDEIERIGELLMEEGVVTQEDVARAISEGGVKGTALAGALEGTKHPRRLELAAFLATDFRVPRIADLRQVDFQQDAVRAVPEELARKHEMVPVARLGMILCVAKPNYYNRAAVQDLRRHTGLKVKVLQADEGQVKAAIERVYSRSRADLPAPKPRESTMRRRIASPPSLPGKVTPEPIPLVAPAEPVKAPARRDAVEVLNAVRVPPSEFHAEERSAPVRLLREWEDLFLAGRPSAPIKVG